MLSPAMFRVTADNSLRLSKAKLFLGASFRIGRFKIFLGGPDADVFGHEFDGEFKSNFQKCFQVARNVSTSCLYGHDVPFLRIP